MARALRAWAINRRGKNSVRNLRYGPRTRLVGGIYAQNYAGIIRQTPGKVENTGARHGACNVIFDKTLN